MPVCMCAHTLLHSTSAWTESAYEAQSKTKSKKHGGGVCAHVRTGESVSGEMTGSGGSKETAQEKGE